MKRTEPTNDQANRMVDLSSTTQWWEIVVAGDPLLEELIFCQLQAFGCQGTASQVEDQVLTVKAYRPHKQVEPKALEQLAMQLHQEAVELDCAPPTIQWNTIAETDWANNWKAHWHPKEIGDRLLIYPEWLTVPYNPERLLLRLNPGAAFGTGEHATTQLCLQTLESLLTSGKPIKTIADIGCGSGILSIAALLLGVDRAYGVDTETLAVDVARANRELNGIGSDRFPVELGSIDRLQDLIEDPVDGFVCNILAEVILQLIPQFGQIIQPEGWGILSGILSRQVPTITTALEQYGWRVVNRQQQEDWCCLQITNRL